MVAWSYTFILRMHVFLTFCHLNYWSNQPECWVTTIWIPLVGRDLRRPWNDQKTNYVRICSNFVNRTHYIGVVSTKYDKAHINQSSMSQTLIHQSEIATRAYHIVPRLYLLSYCTSSPVQKTQMQTQIWSIPNLKCGRSVHILDFSGYTSLATCLKLLRSNFQTEHRNYHTNFFVVISVQKTVRNSEKFRKKKYSTQ